MGLKGPRRWPWAPWPLLGLVAGIVDEAGRYRPGGDIGDLAPLEPTEEDRNASVDLSKQPIDKIFKLLAYELFREEKRPRETHFGVAHFQAATELSCEERLIDLALDAGRVSEEVHIYHQNVTSTSGLYWILHKYPEEHSWVWLISVSHDRVMRKVENHISRMSALALDDEGLKCMSPGFRTVLMNAIVVWKRMAGDHIALLWNGVAFGVLGDVTSWRELDEDGETTEAGPGGPPPNVSWSENLIFANMWISSVQKWLQHHAQELRHAAYSELSRAQAGQPGEDPGRWLQGKDGALSSFEYLRRQLWGGWQLDKGFLRGLLRHCLQPGYGDSAPVSVADFGAGGGQYSEWLNDTGLVEAVAFDSTASVQEITGGSVQELDLADEVQLWRTFNWVICLDVGPHLPPERARRLFRSVRRHADRGLVASWPSNGAGSPDALNEPAFVALTEVETGFTFDASATELLRQSCDLPRLASSVAIFRRTPPVEL